MLSMRFLPLVCFCLSITLLSGSSISAEEKQPEKKQNQYEAEGIVVLPASATEAVRETFSLEAAVDYINKGTTAWNKGRKCVACHTNASYMAIRPSLTKALGKPSVENRDFFVNALKELKGMDRRKLRGGTRPAQAIYIAAGLAEWDAHVTGQLSAETSEALEFMFQRQEKTGTWGSLNCWPPHESSAYHLATVAAQAAATAPGWLKSVENEELTERIEKLKTYLRTTKTPHDYGRVLLLWASTRMDGLLKEGQKEELIKMIWSHQQKDGGWSIRTFAKPDEWGNGNRAEKLRGEPEFKNPPSDGHQTGLALLVLRESGVRADDARIQKGVQWLLANQRQSGRWWTRSLNTDKFHFVTYSGTIYPLSALEKCNALPPMEKTTAAK